MTKNSTHVRFKELAEDFFRASEPALAELRQQQELLRRKLGIAVSHRTPALHRTIRNKAMCRRHFSGNSPPFPSSNENRGENQGAGNGHSLELHEQERNSRGKQHEPRDGIQSHFEESFDGDRDEK